MRGRVRWTVVVAAALAAGTARGQTAAPPPPPPPAATAPAPAPAPGSQSTAGSQGQSSSAQPSSPGAASQQVVVNPPQPQPVAPPPQPVAPPPQPAAPPASSTTVVNPPPSTGGTGSSVVVTPPPPSYGDVGVTDRPRERPSPLATVALDAGFGGVAGLLVGGGVALVQQGDRWGRDLSVGAGLGLILGAAVGIVHATYDQQRYARAARAAGPAPGLAARDGLGRTDRDPVITGPTLTAIAGRF